jgi:DNA-binding CsgD family transcriptional regulator
MKKINELELLVKNYKKKKDEQSLNQIFKLLNNVLKEKAKYIFYKQSFFGKDGLKLCDTKQVELNDVMQELYLELLRIIDNYMVKEPFENYLYANLKLWRPKFINVDFLKNLKTKSIYRLNEEGEEENLADNISIPEPINIEFSLPLTKKEQKVWELLQGNLNLSQEKIAEEMDISQKYVSNLITSIKNKIQK